MTDVLYFASFAGAIDEQLVGEMPPCGVLLFQRDNLGDICSVFCPDLRTQLASAEFVYILSYIHNVLPISVPKPMKKRLTRSENPI